MSTSKKITLGVYAVLAILAITQSDIALGAWALRILLIIAAVHVVEMLVFFTACRAAGGSLAGHLVNVFLFGVIHMQELKNAKT